MTPLRSNLCHYEKITVIKRIISDEHWFGKRSVTTVSSVQDSYTLLFKVHVGRVQFIFISNPTQTDSFIKYQQARKKKSDFALGFPAPQVHRPHCIAPLWYRLYAISWLFRILLEIFVIDLYWGQIFLSLDIFLSIDLSSE